MSKKSSSSSKGIKQYMMLIALVVIVAIFQWMTNGVLLKPMNVSNLINQNAYVVILAVGMLVCILTGGNIDLAVGSVVALVGACAGTFIVNWGMNSYIAVILCLAIGIIIGMWQGFWIAYVRIPAFIVTLSGQLVFRGMTLLILKGLTIAPFPQDFQGLSTGFIPDFIGAIFGYSAKPNITSLTLGVIIAIVFCVIEITGRIKRKKKNYPVDNIAVMLLRILLIGAAVIWLFYKLAMYRGVPTVLITLGIILIVYAYITSKTVMGRHIYAIGGNEKAAKLSGVKTNKMLFLAYVNMSFLAAVAGIIFAARLNSASPQAGQGFELDAIGACYIGGASAYGGIGTVTGSLIGALVMGVLNNGMSIMGISSNAQQVVKGLVLLAAVAIDVISKQKLLTPFLAKLKRGKDKA